MSAKTLLDPNLLDTGSEILKVFPQLSKYPEFSTDNMYHVKKRYNEAKILKWIILCYDIKSDFREVTNVYKRKIDSALSAGFEKGPDGYIYPSYIRAINGDDQVVNKWIIRYCRIQHSAKFSKLCVYEDELYRDLQGLKDLTEPNARRIAIQNINNLESEVGVLQREFLAGDETKNIVDELYNHVEIEQLELTPEDIAHKIKNGEDAVGDYSPYKKRGRPKKLNDNDEEVV